MNNDFQGHFTEISFSNSVDSYSVQGADREAGR